MKPISVCLLWIALATMFTFAAGCGKKEAKLDDDEAPKGSFSKVGGKPTPTSRSPLKAPLDGVITGKVTLKGGKPPTPEVATMRGHADASVCMAGKESEKIKQEWIIGPGDGVANVVIFLRAPTGKYFELTEEVAKRKDQVIIDQPHCAFVPHVAAAFPSYWDGKELKPSGQQFIVKNSAPLLHNTQWAGDSLKTGGGNQTLSSKSELPIKLVPEPNPIQISCSIHPWMKAFVWAYDHPFFAVTKEDGSFEIKNVPTGVELSVVAWHEATNFFHGGKDGVKQKFNAGANTLDLTITPK